MRYLYFTYSDDEIIRLFSDGDDKAFETLYNRYWEILLGVAINKTGNIALAEEIVQDIFVDLWKRRETIKITGSLAAYLAVALKYKVIDARRKQSRQKAVLQNIANNYTITDDSTLHQLSFEELQSRLAALVTSLPRKCQLVYRLSREGGLSQKQIATQLNISEKTVESHLSRAISNLKLNLKNLFSLFI